MILQHLANHQVTIHRQHVDVNATSSVTFVKQRRKPSGSIMIGVLHLQQNQLCSYIMWDCW